MTAFIHRDETRGPCPSCGAELDAATGLTSPEAPEPGDCSICAYCGSILVFTETTFRLPTREELRAFMALELVRDAVLHFGRPV